MHTHIYSYTIHTYIYIYIHTHILDNICIYIYILQIRGLQTNGRSTGLRMRLMDVSAWMGWKMYPLVIWHSYGKSPCFMGKLTISMAIFHSYVKLLEGSWCSFTLICVNVLWSTWKIIETLYTCFVLKICAFHLTAVRAICGKPTSRNTWTAWRFVPWAMFYAASWVATRRPRFW